MWRNMKISTFLRTLNDFCWRCGPRRDKVLVQRLCVIVLVNMSPTGIEVTFQKVPLKDQISLTIGNCSKICKIKWPDVLADVDTKTSIKDISSKAAQLLELIAKDKEKNAGQISDVHVARFVHEKILTLPCQNQGYVLDGYPISYESGKDLFAPSRQQSLAATGKKDADRPKAGAENTASDITLLPGTRTDNRRNVSFNLKWKISKISQ